ncbi:TetR/AcrR family transcriptional regulator [Microbacterium aurantiacum]|uniref:TetR/AcrR family transcriptional regulator n=1 Tax=Microbacterium aurantiacum TaxID=162393 RepID=UPI000C800BE9|nr:TetR/AcrR family transcriptional regulator [Microbacterium aurantiacum]
MPRASAAEAAETARRILESATAHFAEHGVAAASVDDIARSAGVTRGAVYHHYASKPRLFAAVAAAQQQLVADAIVAATAGQDAADALRIGSHAFLDAITRGAAARVLLVEGPAALSWAEWRRGDAEGAETQLREGLADAGVASALLDAVTAALSGAMNELALWLSQQPRDEATRESAHRALDLLLDAIIPA